MYTLQDELNVPSDLSNSPFLVSVLPQLKRNTAALKPPEAAALASLLLKRKELDRLVMCRHSGTSQLDYVRRKKTNKLCNTV